MRTVFLPAATPPAAEEDCDDPVELPDRDLGEDEATKLWGRDRLALSECKARKRASRGGQGGHSK